MAKGKRNRQTREQRAEREARRRQANDARNEREASEFGVKLPPKPRRGEPASRPDYSDIDWDVLKAHYPDGARKLLRSMFIALIGERAAYAKGFQDWGLRPSRPHPQSRLARDDAEVTLEGEKTLVSSTALYPTMNASESLTAAAEVIALALTQGQMRTSATAALCRIAMESSAKTIWLIGETDTEERIRRCYGFLKGERGQQLGFEKLESAALEARIDHMAEVDLAEFDKRRAREAERHARIAELPAEARIDPTGGAMRFVENAEDWMDKRLPRKPNPDLDRVMRTRSAKSFYALGSGFVHGFKWLRGYVFDDDRLDDLGLLAVTLDAFENALRMTEAAVSLVEAQSIGPQPDPKRVRNYPAGLANIVSDLAPDYLLLAN